MVREVRSHVSVPQQRITDAFPDYYTPVERTERNPPPKKVKKAAKSKKRKS